jgi:hypothetical protein
MGPKSNKRPEPEEESEEEEEEEEVSDEGSEMEEEEEGDDDEVPPLPLTRIPRSFLIQPRLRATHCTTPRQIAGHAKGLLDMVAAAASCFNALLPSERRCPFRACCVLMGRKGTRMEG